MIASGEPAVDVMASTAGAAVRGDYVVIEPNSRTPGLGLREIWRYRGLLGFLVLRDIKARYAQTVLGLGWAVIQPLATMSLFYIVFGRIAKLPSDGMPYSVFSLAALVPWTYFASVLGGSSISLASSSNLITKVYFPRLIIPLVPAAAAIGNLAISFAALLVIAGINGIAPSFEGIALLPIAVITIMAAATGAGCWLSALDIQFRDVRNVTPFLVQLWMYISPVIYSMSMVPPRFRVLFAFNPMTGVIETFRFVFAPNRPVPLAALSMSLIVSLVLLVSGAFFFRQMERVFADVV